MPRPTDKASLLELGEYNFNKLFELIDSLNEEALHGEFNYEHRDRNVRDTVAHLHEWHLMFLKWYKVGMKGDKPAMPAEGYTWKTLPDLNKEIWQKYQGTDLNTGIALLEKSFLKVRKLIETHTDNELFEKKKYNWTGTTSLGAYLVSATSSHYDWAFKQLKKHKRTFAQ